MNDPVDGLTDEQLDRLIDSMRDRNAPPRSTHLDLAIVASMRRRELGRPLLREGEPIPGCTCTACTGLRSDAPTRAVPIATKHRRAAYRPRRDLRPALDLDAARAISIVDVAVRLGIEPTKPYASAREYLVRCPFHDDTRPSLRLDPAKGRWYCDPCARGGDAIGLYREVTGLSFPAAVRELLAA